MSKPFVVESPDRAVDPTEAQRLLDGIVVQDAGLSRVLLVADKPDLFLGFVVLPQPRTPLPTIDDVQQAALVQAVLHGLIRCYVERTSVR